MDKYRVSMDDGKSWSIFNETMLKWLVGAKTFEERLRDRLQEGEKVKSGRWLIEKLEGTNGKPE